MTWKLLYLLSPLSIESNCQVHKGFFLFQNSLGCIKFSKWLYFSHVSWLHTGRFYSSHSTHIFSIFTTMHKPATFFVTHIWHKYRDIYISFLVGSQYTLSNATGINLPFLTRYSLTWGLYKSSKISGPVSNCWVFPY